MNGRREQNLRTATGGVKEAKNDNKRCRKKMPKKRYGSNKCTKSQSNISTTRKRRTGTNIIHTIYANTIRHKSARKIENA